MEELSDFDLFWNAYPPRKGDKAKQPAKVLFEKHIKAGIDPKTIIEAAKKFAGSEPDKIGTEFIMQAVRWLRHKRWVDYDVGPNSPAELVSYSNYFAREGTPQWEAWQAHLLKTKMRKSPMKNFGWWFPTEWPPHE